MENDSNDNDNCDNRFGEIKFVSTVLNFPKSTYVCVELPTDIQEAATKCQTFAEDYAKEMFRGHFKPDVSIENFDSWLKTSDPLAKAIQLSIQQIFYQF